ncbi:MAG: ATP-binding protein [Rhodococcus sp. (in: high G+C Gram-positive bacteria)]
MSSPTRLREDAAVEADLVAGGYRDRVVTELAQNAADAATRAGVPGRMAVWARGNDLHVANIGAPLTASGVQALSALRASDKDGASDKDEASAGSVGRYGVGFTAVRALSEHLEILSTTGSITFEGTRTRSELDRLGVAEPAQGAPVLRLPWPAAGRPAAGWDTEIVLRDVDDPASIVSTATSEAVDLLLELDGLESISLSHDGAEDELVRSTAPGPGAWTEVRIGSARWWRGDTSAARWYLPMLPNHQARPVTRDVLRAPTRSDETLTLPLLLVADVALQPDRRRVLPGTNLSGVADGLGALTADLPPALRTSVVPAPGLPASEVDQVVRAAVLRELESTAWVPTAAGRAVRPSECAVVESISTEFAELLVDVVPGLVAPESSHRAAVSALTAVGARRLDLSSITLMLSGISRPPSWWRQVYTELDAMIHDSADIEECAALPVPLTDGRTVTGPRTVLLVDGENPGSVGWARVVHPGAAHPLLGRMGAQVARPTDLLADPALAALLDDPDGVSDDLVHDVLSLAATVGGVAAESAGAGATGSLPLQSDTGELRAADELVLPGSPLLEVLAADHPFGVVAASVVAKYGVDALRVVGVGWTLGTVTDTEPTGPDHDLDDEDQWWTSGSMDPPEVRAVRDLDLVDEERWAQALTLILDHPDTAATLRDRSGYTAWWLRRHAVLGGTPLGLLRLAADTTLEGLLDIVDHPRAAEFSTALSGDGIDDAETVSDILAAASERARVVSPAVSIRMHRMLADAVDSGRVDVRDVDPPEAVRTLAGTVADPDAVVVLDHPRWIALIPAELAVLGSMEGADTLSDLLDVPTASSALDARVVSTGERAVVDDRPELAAARAAAPWAFPDVVILHERLTVRCGGVVSLTRAVPFWVTDGGEVHLSMVLTGGV